jgi:hypothetical protein
MRSAAPSSTVRATSTTPAVTRASPATVAPAGSRVRTRRC